MFGNRCKANMLIIDAVPYFMETDSQRGVLIVMVR
jgi:hypothetical protein